MFYSVKQHQYQLRGINEQGNKGTSYDYIASYYSYMAIASYM